MKHPRTIFAIVAATVLLAAVAAVVAASAGSAHGADATASPPSGATAATATSASAAPLARAATAAPWPGGAATGTAGMPGVLRLVNPGGPMIAADGSSVTVSHRVVVTAHDHAHPAPGPVRGL